MKYHLLKSMFYSVPGSMPEKHISGFPHMATHMFFRLVQITFTIWGGLGEHDSWRHLHMEVSLRIKTIKPAKLTSENMKTLLATVVK